MLQSEERKFLGKIKADQEVIGKFYNVSDDTLCCALNECCLDMGEANKVAQEVFKIMGNDQTEMLIMTSKHMRSLLDKNDDDLTSESIAKTLCSSTWTNRQLNSNYLAQPNTLSGLPAALLTMAELKKKRCLLICNFIESESVDSKTLKGFIEAVQAVPFISLQSQKVSMQRMKQCYQSPNTLYT